MSSSFGHADDERNEIIQRSFSAPSQVVNGNGAKGYTDLTRYAFMNNNQEKDSTSTSTSLTSLYNVPQNFPHYAFSPTPIGYETSGPTSRTGPRPIYLGAQQSASREFSFENTMTNFGHRSPREIHYNQGLHDALPRDFDVRMLGPQLESGLNCMQDYEHASTSPQYGPHENPAFDMYSLREWSPTPVSTSMFPRPSSSLKAAPARTRTRTTPRHQHHQYLDSLLRSKCPKDRLQALNIAIQFRDEHHADELIPNDLLDELLEAAGEDKFFCFCCPRARKARTITPARDHVRKSLGNFPFQCSNSWCRHSSLRQADLNKHMKTCVNTAAQ